MICLVMGPLCWFHPVYADNWRGSIRSKVQTDNRYDRDGDYTGEVWADFIYDNTDYGLTGRFAGISRFSTDIYRNRLQFYQAYLEKNFEDLSLNVRGGRFEKSDSLGLYLIDGASAKYRFEKRPIAIEVYAGRPLRIDHVRSVDGEWVAGFEEMINYAPRVLLSDALYVENADLRVGLQVLQRGFDPALDEFAIVQRINQNFDLVDEEVPIDVSKRTYRLTGATRFSGYLWENDKPYEMFLQGTYALESERFENVLLDSWWDFRKNFRLRNYFEAYRPREPFVAFRDRFYAAYALGQQEIWRGLVEHKYNHKLRYSLGGQFASRDDNFRGFGIQSAVNYQVIPGLDVQGQFDHLDLNNGESATSVYFTGFHAFNERSRVALNLAWRLEDKLLVGKNMAKGIETEVNYMIDSSLVLRLSASFVENSNINDEYLGALQFTYFYDRFQPSEP